MPKEIFVYSRSNEEKLSYTWTILDFETFPGGTQLCIRGSSFNVSFSQNTTWKVFLYRNYHNPSINAYCPKLVIETDDLINDLLLVKYTVYIKNSEKSKEVVKSEIQSKGIVEKINVFLPRITALKEENFLENGSLIIECLLSFVSYSNSFDILPESVCSQNLVCLSENLQNLYSSKNLADFTLLVENEVISVHKCILASRSPVFAAMFNQVTEENDKNELIIEDFGADTMKCLVAYLYAGNISDLSPDMYFQLYSASDKYDIQVLKKTCLNEIIKSLDASNACDVFALSYFHNDTTLRIAATRYIQRNSASVFRSESWEKLLAKNVALAAEIVKIVTCTV